MRTSFFDALVHEQRKKQAPFPRVSAFGHIRRRRREFEVYMVLLSRSRRSGPKQCVKVCQSVPRRAIHPGVFSAVFSGVTSTCPTRFCCTLRTLTDTLPRRTTSPGRGQRLSFWTT